MCKGTCQNNEQSRTVHKSGVLPVQACRRPQSFLRKLQRLSRRTGVNAHFTRPQAKCRSCCPHVAEQCCPEPAVNLGRHNISFGPKHLTSTPATPIIARLAATTQWAAIRWLEHAGYQQMRQNWPTAESDPTAPSYIPLELIFVDHKVGHGPRHLFHLVQAP